MKVVYPAQCKCGHIFLETFQWKKINDNGYIGFAWCGWCRKRRWVKPLKEADSA